MIRKKDLKDAIDEATADIISAVTKGFETVATKEELRNVEMKLSNEIKNVEMKLSNEIKDVKRQINDLKADLPTPQEFQGHDKRISALESAVFPS